MKLEDVRGSDDIKSCIITKKLSIAHFILFINCSPIKQPQARLLSYELFLSGNLRDIWLFLFFLVLKQIILLYAKKKTYISTV